jgi:outer membrane protein assembly factor BamB
MLKRLYKTIAIFIIFSFCFLSACSNTIGTDSAQGPVAIKIQELHAIYQKKKAEGYDLQDVEKSMGVLRSARQSGNRDLFLKTMRKIENQLAQAQVLDSPLVKNSQAGSKQLSPSVFLENSPWPMYGHDRRHTCRSPYKGLSTQPTAPKWTFTSPGSHGISSPVSIDQDGNLYLGTWKNEDFARNKIKAKSQSGLLCKLSTDGRLIWTHDSKRGSLLASAIESSPLLMADGKIIYGKDDGHVYALNREGKLLWDFSCDDVYSSSNPYDDNEQVIPSPVLGPNGILYVCSHWGNVYDPMTMRELGKLNPQVKELGIKSVKQPRWSKIYAIDPENGNRLWVYDLSIGDQSDKRTIFGSPAIGDDGTIYFGTYDNTHSNGYLYALNPEGTLKWIFSQTDIGHVLGLPGSPSIADDGTIYIGSSGGKKQARVYAVNPDGTLKWSYKVLENRITGAPGIAPDGTIYVGAHNWGFLFNPKLSKNGHFYALKDTGKKAELAWRFKVNYGILAPPAIDNQGNVFFGTYGDPKSGQMGPHRIFALNNKGKTLWSYDLKGKVYSPPVIDKTGAIYVGTTGSEAKLYAFGL